MNKFILQGKIWQTPLCRQLYYMLKKQISRLVLFYSTPSTEGVESTRGNSVCGSVCGFVCPSSLFPSSNIQWFDGLDHANHIFSESSSCWQPVPPCSDPVTPSTNQYRPLLTKYSMIWWFRPCKPNIFWKHITLATNTALFWSSITKYRPVPPYTDAVPPSNNHCCPLPTKYNQVLISTA